MNGGGISGWAFGILSTTKFYIEAYDSYGANAP